MPPSNIPIPYKKAEPLGTSAESILEFVESAIKSIEDDPIALDYVGFYDERAGKIYILKQVRDVIRSRIAREKERREQAFGEPIGKAIEPQ